MLEGLRVYGCGRQRLYRLTEDELARLIQIIREDLGDKLSQPAFAEAVLQLFEDIAGFETLPRNAAQRYLSILWQSYETACRAPEKSK
jgi:DNA-binding FadR family transcriptional regulator